MQINSKNSIQLNKQMTKRKKRSISSSSQSQQYYSNNNNNNNISIRYDEELNEQQQNQCNLRNILYGFNEQTTTEEKLSQMKNCLDELPADMLRNVAFLPANNDQHTKTSTSSKQMMKETKGFTSKMRESFMRMKQCLDPNMNAQTLQGFYKMKQRESQRIQENYGYTPEIARVNKIMYPQIIHPISNRESKTNNVNSIDNTQLYIEDIFQTEQSSTAYQQLSSPPQQYSTTNQQYSTTTNQEQSPTYHQQSTTYQEQSTTNTTTQELSHNQKYFSSERNITNHIRQYPLLNLKFKSKECSSVSPSNQYSNSAQDRSYSTQDRSQQHKQTTGIKERNFIKQKQQQTSLSSQQFYEMQSNQRGSNKRQVKLPQFCQTVRAQTSRSLSNTAGRNMLFRSDQKENNKDNIFSILHSNYNNNPNYPCQKHRTDLTTTTTQCKTSDTQNQPIEITPDHLQPNQLSTPIQQQNQLSTTKQVSQEAFFQKKVRRNALIDLRKLNPNIQKMTQYSKDFLPPWLRSRADFLKMYFQDQINRNLQLPLIFVKDAHQRTLSEKQETMKYIESIEEFSKFNGDIIELIQQKIKVEIFYNGETIQERDEMSDKIIILYEGTAKRIWREGGKEQDLEKKIALNSIHVRQQHQNEYSIRCETNAIFFTLDAQDIRDVENCYAKSIANEFYSMLSLHDFFHTLEPQILRQIASAAQGKLLFAHENLFNVGDKSDEIYFVFFGKIEKRRIFYTQERNRWPINKVTNEESDENEQLQQTQHGYRVFTKHFTNSSEVGRSEIFGDQEAIYEVGRRTQAIALEPTFLLYVNRQTFLNILPLHHLNSFEKYRSYKPIKLSPQHHTQYYFQQQIHNKSHKDRVLSALDVVFSHENYLQQLRKLEKRIEPFKQDIIHKFHLQNSLNKPK